MIHQKIILDYIYQHEVNRAGQVVMTQPIGGGKVVDYTWAQVADQARRMAAHLKGMNLAPGSRIAILSKNTAHFMMAELAIWMAGHTTVAIFPTETADTVRYVLTHSEASLLFVGKLDNFKDQASGVPSGLPCIALPLAPDADCPTWEEISRRTQPLAGKPTREGSDLMFIMYTSGSTGTPKGVMHSFERGTLAAESIVAHQEEDQGAGFDYRVLGDPQVRAAFEKEMRHVLARVNSKVADYEHLRMIVIARNPWTIESGLLTPTIRRSKIEAVIAPDVEQWYTSQDDVVWS